MQNLLSEIRVSHIIILKSCSQVKTIIIIVPSSLLPHVSYSSLGEVPLLKFLGDHPWGRDFCTLSKLERSCLQDFQQNSEATSLYPIKKKNNSYSYWIHIPKVGRYKKVYEIWYSMLRKCLPPSQCCQKHECIAPQLSNPQPALSTTIKHE